MRVVIPLIQKCLLILSAEIKFEHGAELRPSPRLCLWLKTFALNLFEQEVANMARGKQSTGQCMYCRQVMQHFAGLFVGLGLY
jgi:hypothetical protein